MIQVQNLVKKFGDLTAVNDISFNVAGGRDLCFSWSERRRQNDHHQDAHHPAESDQRKNSTGRLDPAVHKNEVRRKFGIVFQDPSLDSEQTAYENMELHAVLYKVPRKERAERIEHLLKLFELWDRRDDYVKTFSGGMKRRLEIARGFLHTPKILFLDEPTLGLDPQTRNQLWTHVKHLNETQKTTVFLTTHYMDEADRVAHRIAIIDHGGIVAQGTSQELKQQTNSESLEEAFLALTGSSIRDESATSADQMRQVAKMWSQRR